MFDGLYRAVIADTEASKEIHFNLRYQVYCLEKQFEPTACINTHQEIDKFDVHSIHFLIQHKLSGQWVGAARLVQGGPESLPMAELTRTCLPSGVAKHANFAELSRLSILKSFRRHGGETRVSEPEVLLGLIRATKEYSENHAIDYWMFLCRRSIMRIVGSLGMEMEVIGSPCEHRGIRYPYLARLATAFDGIPDRSAVVEAMFARKNTLSCYSSLQQDHHHSLAA